MLLKILFKITIYNFNVCKKITSLLHFGLVGPIILIVLFHTIIYHQHKLYPFLKINSGSFY